MRIFSLSRYGHSVLVFLFCSRSQDTLEPTTSLSLEVASSVLAHCATSPGYPWWSMPASELTGRSKVRAWLGSCSRHLEGKDHMTWYISALTVVLGDEFDKAHETTKILYRLCMKESCVSLFDNFEFNCLAISRYLV